MAAFPRLADQSKVVPWAAQMVRELGRSVKNTAFGSARLQPGETATLVLSSAVRTGSQVFIVPVTAAAAAEVATTFVSTIQDGSFVLSHADNAVDDRWFNFVIHETAGRSQVSIRGGEGPVIVPPPSTTPPPTTTPPPSQIDIRNSGVDLTGAVDSRAALQAFLDGVPDGSTILMPPDSVIKLSGEVKVSNKTLFLDWTTCRINGSLPTKLFVFEAAYEAVQAVSSIANGRNVTVVNGSAFSPGDVIKILSDDPDHFGSTTNVRQGEWVAIASISLNVLTLTSDLENTYTTGIRVARPARQRLTWKGGIIDYPGILGSPSNEEVITLSGYSNAIIEGLRIRRGFGSGVELIGCINAEVRNCDIRHLDDATVDIQSPNSFGYGVASGSSLRTKVENCVFSNIRHGFATRPRGVSAGSSQVEKYGHDEGALVTGNLCLNSKGTAFDTHHSTRRAQFIANEAMNSTSYGYAVRGIDILLRGNVSNKCQQDVLGFVQSGVAATGTNLIRLIDHTSVNSGRLDTDVDMLVQNYQALGHFRDAAAPGNSDLEVFRVDSGAVMELHGATTIDLNDPPAANFEYIKIVNGTIINHGLLTFRTQAGTNTGTASLIDRQASGSYFMGKTRVIGPGLARIIRDNGETYDPDLMFGSFVIDDGSSIALSSNDADSDLIGGATLSEFTAALTSGVMP